jgi:hypothetical protein
MVHPQDASVFRQRVDSLGFQVPYFDSRFSKATFRKRLKKLQVLIDLLGADARCQPIRNFRPLTSQYVSPNSLQAGGLCEPGSGRWSVS